MDIFNRYDHNEKLREEFFALIDKILFGERFLELDDDQSGAGGFPDRDSEDVPRTDSEEDVRPATLPGESLDGSDDSSSEYESACEDDGTTGVTEP